jgi:hypothetical protein
VLLPIEAALAVAEDPHMMDTVNIDQTAKQMGNDGFEDMKKGKKKRLFSPPPG